MNLTPAQKAALSEFIEATLEYEGDFMFSSDGLAIAFEQIINEVAISIPHYRRENIVAKYEITSEY